MTKLNRKEETASTNREEEVEEETEVQDIKNEVETKNNTNPTMSMTLILRVRQIIIICYFSF